MLIYNPKTDKVYLVANGMWLEYIEHGGPCGEMGLPVDTEGSYTEVKTAVFKTRIYPGVYQNFEKGNLYWYMESASNFPSYAVKGEIFKQYKALNIHFGKLGYPIEEEKDGCQKFQGGVLCKRDDDPLSNKVPSEIKHSFEIKLKEIGLEFYLGSYGEVCGSFYQEVIGPSGKNGQIIYNPNNKTVFFIKSTRVVDKYYSIDNYCSKLGFPISDESNAGIGQKPSYYQDRKSDVVEAYWYSFEKGHIYDYKTQTTNYWQTYAIWNNNILNNYSSAGERGFPTQDTQNGLDGCASNILYQRFEYKVVSVLDNVMEKNVDDNRRFESDTFARRNDNLVCAYLNSHLSLREVQTDHDAYISTLQFINNKTNNRYDFIEDASLVFIGTKKLRGIGYSNDDDPDNIYHTSFRGSGIYYHDVFSDEGFANYFRDSKFHNGQYEGFGYNTSSYALNTSKFRSNQLYHATGGVLAGFSLSEENGWHDCSLAIAAVDFHEYIETGWNLGETPKNGGSTEDLILNYITAFYACELKDGQYFNEEDFISEIDTLSVDNDKLKHITHIWRMNSAAIISDELTAQLEQFIINY